MKILITGASGFIGSSIIDFLTMKNIVEQPIYIRCLIRKTSNIKRILSIEEKIKKNSINNVEINFFYGDVTEPQSLVEAVKEVDFIIHCAALLRTNKIEDYYKVNHLGTKNLLEAIRLHNPNLKCLVSISSQAVSGPCEINRKKSVEEKCSPVSHYGKSKLLSEDELLKYSKLFKTIILRPGPVYGPYDKDMFLYFQYAQKGFLPVFSNEFFVQFTFITDLTMVCKKILELHYKISAGTYFVAEEQCYDIKSLKEIFSEIVGKKIKILKLPYFIAYTYAYLNEQVHKYLLKKPAVFNRDKLDELKHSYWLCQSSPIKEILNFNYTPLKEGLKKTYLWYKENKWL